MYKGKRIYYGPVERCFPLFSDEDSDLAALKWWTNRNGYAQRTSKRCFTAHRIVLSRILGRELAPKDICDHINRVKLDNRRENLRLTTPAGNALNRTPTTRRPRSAGAGLGVTFHKRTKKWYAQFNVGRQSIFCGSFDSFEDAVKASRSKRTELGLSWPTKDEAERQLVEAGIDLQRVVPV